MIGFGLFVQSALCVIFSLCVSKCSAFSSPAPLKQNAREVKVAGVESKFGFGNGRCSKQHSTISYKKISKTSSSALWMSQNGGSGKGLLYSFLGIGVIVLFLGSSILPLFDGIGGDRNLSIADSVVTQQDKPDKLRNYEAAGDRLSRAAIQEKLNSIPVFYLVDDSAIMSTEIFLSYADATLALLENSGMNVKATTMDQVAYPLILERGRMRMAPPPAAIKKAEDALNDENNKDSKKSYRLVASKSSLKAAAEYNTKMDDGDFPLFVADRLAFAGGARGPQLPLFLEKEDCVSSYERLREVSKTLPEIPNIRTTTLKTELTSMEKGSRPGVAQLVFYASVPDLTAGSNLMQ